MLSSDTLHFCPVGTEQTPGKGVCRIHTQKSFHAFRFSPFSNLSPRGLPGTCCFISKCHFSSKISPFSAHSSQFRGPCLNYLTSCPASAQLFGGSRPFTHISDSLHTRRVPALLLCKWSQISLKRHLFLRRPPSEIPWRLILQKTLSDFQRAAPAKYCLRKRERK